MCHQTQRIYSITLLQLHLHQEGWTKMNYKWWMRWEIHNLNWHSQPQVTIMMSSVQGGPREFWLKIKVTLPGAILVIKSRIKYEIVENQNKTSKTYQHILLFQDVAEVIIEGIKEELCLYSFSSSFWVERQEKEMRSWPGRWSFPSRWQILLTPPWTASTICQPG